MMTHIPDLFTGPRAAAHWSTIARQALLNDGISTLEQLAKVSRRDLRYYIPGIGPVTLARIRVVLEQAGYNIDHLRAEAPDLEPNMAISIPNTRQLPADTAAHLIKFLEKASPDEIESLLSTAHAYLQAGLAETSLHQTRQVLARDGR